MADKSLCHYLSFTAHRRNVVCRRRIAADTLRQFISGLAVIHFLPIGGTEEGIFPV